MKSKRIYCMVCVKQEKYCGSFLKTTKYQLINVNLLNQLKSKSYIEKQNTILIYNPNK